MSGLPALGLVTNFSGLTANLSRPFPPQNLRLLFHPPKLSKTLDWLLAATMACRLSRHLAATTSPLRRAGLLPRRAYGSAAVALVDDYYYDCYSDNEERVSQPRLETERLVPERGVQWLIMGDRGAKKHLYADRLSKLLQVPHISMGSLVRQELNPRSSLYKQVW